jgi:hypothetical protein
MLKRWTVCALLAVPWMASAQVDGGLKPQPKVGEVAVFAINLRTDRKTYDETVTTKAIEGDVVRYLHARAEGGPGETEGLMTRELALLVSGSSGTRFEPAVAQAQWPLTVGASWKSAYDAIGTNQVRSRAEIDYKVTAIEKVDTPAGPFEAFRIESGGWINGVSWSGSFRVEQVQWYAPSIGRFVRQEYKDYRNGRLWNDRVSELKSLKTAP